MNNIKIIFPLALSMALVISIFGCGNVTGDGTSNHNDILVNDVTAEVIYVSKTGSDETGTGTKESPYRTIQKAFNKATHYDIISVEAGTYLENLIWPDKMNITLKGISSAETTISFEGAPYGIYISNIPALSFITIEGLTLKNATTCAVWISRYGTKAFIRNSYFTENKGTGNGAAIHMQNYDDNYNNCTLEVEDCAFIDNLGHGGGAIYSSSSLVARRCRFINNISEHNGGAIYIDNYVYRAEMNIERCLFSGNKSHFSGGAIFSYAFGRIENCLFFNNRSKKDEVGESNIAGGAMYCDPILAPDKANIINCTIVSNESGTARGSAIAGGPMNILNSVIWGNVSSYATYNEREIRSTNATINYSDISIWPSSYSGGLGTMEADPDLIGYPPNNENDLTMFGGSPCIGAGTIEGAPSVNYLGQTRFEPYCMGAY